MLRWLLLSVVTFGLMAADLAGGIERLLDTIPAGGRAGVLVYDNTTRKMLYRRNGEALFAPASVVKLIVSAAALLELGPDWRFRTRLVALGPQRGDTIPGLGIDANGDPCLDEHFSDGDPERFFREWATKLKTLGIRRIDGDIVVDRSRFSGPVKAPTWPQDHSNQQSWYSAPSSAFAWNDNCIRLRVIPTDNGRPARIEMMPLSPLVPVSNRTQTSPKAANNVIAHRANNSNAITVSGTYSQRSGWLNLGLHDNADLAAAGHLAAVFARQGITISGSVVAGNVPHDARELLSEEHSLGQAVDIFNQHSQNFYGEQIIRVLGWQRFREGSVTAGTRAVQTILREHLGKDLGGYTLLDGSGLSYDNQACADFLARLLVFMDAHPLGPRYRNSLKIMNHGSMQGRVKTGLLAIARCLTGYLDRSDGSRVTFVILLNRGEAKTTGWMIGLREKIFAVIGDNIQ